MKNVISAFTLLSAFLAGHCDAAEHAFALTPESGARLMNQCSRSAPKDATSFWTPTKEEINRVETRLPAFLESMKARPLEEFNRQYVGFSKQGKRYLYGNFYIRAIPAEHQDKVPVLVCDGGDSFWGVVFDLGSMEFSDFSRNGAI